MAYETLGLTFEQYISLNEEQRRKILKSAEILTIGGELF